MNDLSGRTPGSRRRVRRPQAPGSAPTSLTSLPPRLEALLDAERRMYLLSLGLRIESDRARHAWRPDEAGTSYAGSAAARVVLGRYYREILRHYFDVPSEDYSAAEGVAKAVRLRPERREELLGFAADARPDRPRSRGEIDAREVVLDLDALRTRAAGGDVRCAVLLARCRDVGCGAGVIVERYRSARPGGRRFAVGVSVQQLPREIRREVLAGPALFRRQERAVEVDVVNCLPSVVLQIARERLGLEVVELDRLVRSRGELLGEIASGLGRSECWAKRLVLALCGGASLSGASVSGLLSSADPAHLRPGVEPVGQILLDRALESADRLGEGRAAESQEGGAPLSGTGDLEAHPKLLRSARTLLRLRAELSLVARTLARDRGLDPGGGAAWRLLALEAQAAEDQILRACEGYHARRREPVEALLFDGYVLRLPDGGPDPDPSRIARSIARQTGWRVEVKVRDLG